MRSRKCRNTSAAASRGRERQRGRSFGEAGTQAGTQQQQQHASRRKCSNKPVGGTRIGTQGTCLCQDMLAARSFQQKLDTKSSCCGGAVVKGGIERRGKSADELPFSPAARGKRGCAAVCSSQHAHAAWVKAAKIQKKNRFPPEGRPMVSRLRSTTLRNPARSYPVAWD